MIGTHQPAGLLGGTAHPALASAVAGALGTRPLARTVERFPDSEVGVRLQEAVRGRTVAILQPTGPPVDANLMELLALADAARREGATRLIAVIPYFGYGRGDKRQGRREPVMARLVAELLQSVGIAEVVAVDLHAPQVEGFFRVPLSLPDPMPLLVEAVTPALPEDAVVVSPDVGRLRATSAWAERLGRPLVVLHKQRLDGGYTETACLVGEVRGRTCLLVDDMISTGGTLVQAARVLQQEGAAAPLLAAATHGLLVDQARTRLREAGIGHLWLTDTLPVVDPSPDTHVLSVAALVAEALRETAGDYWQGEGDA